ncbi:SUMF1/EgtB/PvdO family nonheme iron enzyme [Burkholderia humptydooensis]|uniref:SUMF1/EgtB/PvdO family nonheme iron enzyme n=1 Tax=Burkholderia humptydooensis TaxID=430531 RepID=UPI003CC6333E
MAARPRRARVRRPRISSTGPNRCSRLPRRRRARTITGVSWFAARAYCASEGARLPTWLEWSTRRPPTRRAPTRANDPLWRRQILSWYEQPRRACRRASAARRTSMACATCTADLGMVDDFNALFISGDSARKATRTSSASAAQARSASCAATATRC